MSRFSPDKNFDENRRSSISAKSGHVPVLTKEVLEVFNPQPGQLFVDATIDGGGHAAALLEKVGAEGKVFGIDWDCGLVRELQKKKINNLVLICDNYAHIKSIFRKHNLGQVSGVLFDLGFSLYHVKESGRGFSFLKDEPLDMRYSPEFNDLTAEKIINTWPRQAIEDILREYGEERLSRRIADAITSARRRHRISKTSELVKVISRSVPRGYLKSRIHFATRTFQALRIAVNDELENLKGGLEGAMEVTAPRGKIAVIAFHSLEDRIVKNFFREKALQGTLEVITRKPVRPSPSEIKINARAHTARLRAARKII